ncbi:MAG: hypothetical protein ACPHO7_04200, partial [Candidatus Puniceispirillaceae bacterium]
PMYQKPKPKKTSGRGRKPKPKKKSKRKVQGNGRYFSAIITHPLAKPAVCALIEQGKGIATLRCVYNKADGV